MLHLYVCMNDCYIQQQCTDIRGKTMKSGYALVVKIAL